MKSPDENSNKSPPRKRLSPRKLFDTHEPESKSIDSNLREKIIKTACEERNYTPDQLANFYDHMKTEFATPDTKKIIYRSTSNEEPSLIDSTFLNQATPRIDSTFLNQATPHIYTPSFLEQGTPHIEPPNIPNIYEMATVRKKPAYIFEMATVRRGLSKIFNMFTPSRNKSEKENNENRHTNTKK